MTIQDDADNVKKAKFGVAGVSACTTRTYGLPDVSGTLTTTADVGAVSKAMLATVSTSGKVSRAATTASSASTASAIVARDASGNFSAGTITAALTGNASTATVLQTSRAINGVAFNGSADITVADGAKAPLAGGTLTGQLVSAQANSTADGGGQIFLNGTTGNRIDFSTAGGGPPTTTSRSAGTKLVLHPKVTINSVDYGLGIDANTLWSSVPS